MQTPTKKVQSSTRDADSSALFPGIWLSLATVPMLLGIVGIKAASDLLSAIGQGSEEVFRGDRLPVLHFPDSEKHSQVEILE